MQWKFDFESQSGNWTIVLSLRCDFQARSDKWPLAKKRRNKSIVILLKKDRSLKGIYGNSSQTPKGKLNCIPKLHKCINKYSSRLVVWEQNLNFIKPEFSSLNIPFLSSFFFASYAGISKLSNFFQDYFESVLMN